MSSPENGTMSDKKSVEAQREGRGRFGYKLVIVEGRKGRETSPVHCSLRSVFVTFWLLRSNGELDIATANDIRDLEFEELGVEAKIHAYLQEVKRESSSDFVPVTTVLQEAKITRLGITNTHDYSGESLWIVLGIVSMQRERLQIQMAIEIDCVDDVLKGRNDALNSSDMFSLQP